MPLSMCSLMGCRRSTSHPYSCSVKPPSPPPPRRCLPGDNDCSLSAVAKEILGGEVTAEQAKAGVPPSNPLHPEFPGGSVSLLNSALLRIEPSLGAAVVDTSSLHNGGRGHSRYASFGFQILMQPVGYPIVKKDQVCVPEGWDFFETLAAASGDTTSVEMWEHMLTGMEFGNGPVQCPGV